MIDANATVSSESSSPADTSPPYWLVLIVLAFVILAIIYGGIVLSVILFIASVALWWANTYRLERDENATLARKHEEALKGVEARLREATTRHADAASALNGEIANRDATIRERTQELERRDEQHAEERSKMAAGYEAALRELEGQSVKKDQSVWMPGVTDATGAPLSREGLTHYLVLAFPNQGKAGQVPVRFPKEGEPPYEAEIADCRFRLLIEHTMSGHRVTAVVDSSMGGAIRPNVFDTNHPDGAAFLSGEGFAGVFQKNPLDAYRHLIVTRHLAGLAHASMIRDYFAMLRHRASSVGSPLRGQTIVVRVAESPALQRAVDEFNKQ